MLTDGNLVEIEHLMKDDKVMSRAGWKVRWALTELRDALAAERELSRKRGEMLEQLEWERLNPVNARYCQICGNPKGQGHAPDCELAPLLPKKEA